MRRIASLAILILASTFGVAAQAPKSTSSGAAQRTATKAAAIPRHHETSAPAPHANSGYGNVPLSFEENRGQTDSRVKYLGRGKGYTLFLTPTREVLALRRVIPSQKDSQTIADPKAPRNYSQSVLEFDLAGANEQAQISGADRLPGISNYYIGNDPTKWHTGIPNYGKVIYRNAYPGIDLAYYGNQGQLESDFIVAPGADPGKIRMRVDGAQDLQIAAAGDLIVSLEAGSVKLQQPVAYQIIRGVRREIRSGYKLLAANEVGIALAAYDASQKVIIDPTLSFSTYLGGSNGQSGNFASDVAVDSTGEAYVIGATSSTDFPTKTGFQGTLGSGATQNGFVSKFSTDGTSVIFSTYIGGGYFDTGYGIAVDATGNAYAVGNTLSSNFPLQNPLSGQDAFAGGGCGFVSSLSPAGTLLFSTYLCGGTSDAAVSVAVDSNKNIYVVGLTRSTSFPTQNPIQPTLAGAENAFVTKLAPVTGAGSSLVFSTYFGGNGTDYGTGIALDLNSNVYISGVTNSTVFPTKNAIQANLNAKSEGSNGFVAEINAAGNALVYSTYLGGSVNDYANDIAVDSSGNAYVTGGATSPDFPMKDSLQALDAGGDIFVAKVAAGGGSLDFSTLFGGGGEVAGSIALDSSNNIYITGHTTVSDFPTRLPLQATLNGPQAGFLTELRSDGSDYTFSTYLGGSDSVAGASDTAYGVTLDSNNNIYVVGQSSTLDFPTVNPFQAHLNNPASSGFVLKIAPATPAGPQVFPAALNFGTVQTGTSSTEVVTLANGTTALDISSITLSGPDAADFSDFSTCGATVPPTVVCTFTVTFTPASTGTETATVTVTEASGTQTFTLSGTGGATTGPPPGTITVNPTSLTFGSQEVGSTSAEQFLTVNSTGTNPATFSTGTAGADSFDFSVSGDGTCEFGTPLAPGTSCTIAVMFRPTDIGTRTATLQITGNLTTNPVNVMLTGTGTPQIAVLSAPSQQFPNTVVNTTSAPMMATLTNNSSTVALMAINPTIPFSFPAGSFAISGTTCPIGGGLAPGASCTISITFTAVSAGFAEGELSVSDSDAGTSPQTLYFFGTGLNATATLAPISRTYVAFGRQTVGTTSNAQDVFLQNTGNTALTFTTPLSGTNSGAFAVSFNSCSGSIPAGGSCDVSVTFAPTAVGPFFATLTINSGATGAPQTVALSGTGVSATTVSLLPNPLIFPAISVGQSSAVEYAYLNNTGPNADTISGITIPQIPGSDFDDFQVSLTGPGNTPCSFNGVLNAQAVCVIGVVFTPITTGLRTATLEVFDSATGTPHTITLQGGSGIAPLQITTTSPLSGATVGVAYSTTLAATGGTPPYTWSYVSGTLPPGLSVGPTGTISGTPTTAGPYSFVVKVTDSMSPTQNSAQGTFSITVTAATGGLTFSSTTLPSGAVTVPYGADIQVTGGIPPYTFAATGLPTGFTLDTTGVGNAVPGHVLNNAPQNAGTFTFNVTVTDSTTPTPLTGNATVSLTIAAMPANTQPGLLKGQYAMILRGFNEVTGAEEALVGSLTFDGTGNITSGELDVNSTGTAGIESGVSATGSYVIGSDNRGEMSITPEGQAPGIFAISVGKVLNGVAASAYITSFIDDTGAGDLYAGTLQLQDPTAFNNDAFAGTYIYASTGQGPQGTRVSELGLTTLNNANTVTSGSADSNNDGHAGIISTITGTYTTPDSNGRSSLALTVNTTPSTTAVYQVNANEAVYMTLDARDSNVLLVGTAVKQPSPGSFSNASLAGPDVFSLVGSSGPSATSTNIGVLTVTPGASPTVNITLDTNDQGTVTIGRVQTGALSIAANGRGTMSPGGTNLIFYLTQPDTGFVMATDSPVEFGPIQPQTGGPFSATPFANTNLFFGQQEAVGGASSEFSGIANIGASNSFSPVDDESHNGGDLFFDQALGSFTYAVNSSGHITLTSSTQGDSSGYMVSPYETVFMDTNGPASDPAPSAHPHVIVAQSIPAQVASGVTVAPPSLTFTSQTVLTTSAPRSVTVSNNGTAAVTFSGFTVTGTNAADFSVPLPNMPGMCSPTGTLAAGSSCTINVLFTPQAAGTRTATLNVSDSATGSPQTVALSGTGTAPLGTILIAPTSLTFESQIVGTTSATQTVTVSNVGNVNVTFTSIATTGDFSGATTAQCPTLSTDSSPCTFQIAFKPTAAGTRTGAITFTDNATGSPQTVTLTGTGMNGPATVTVSPTSLTFASQTISSTSPAQNVTVTNTGTGPVNFTSFSITGENSSSFALASGANACNPTGTLAANASCTIGVTFTPTATGELGATLSITDNATTSPQLVSLNGTGNNSPVIITIPPGGSTTGTATPGGTAFFGLQITGAPGVTGTVQLGCTPSSPTITCNVIPSSIVLTGKPIEVAFGIQTYCQGATNTGFAPSVPGTWPTGGIALLLLSLALGASAWAMQRNRRVALTFAVLMLVALGSAACGGLAKGPNGATPPGTYSLTLTTTFNGQTQTMPNFLTLVVK